VPAVEVRVEHCYPEASDFVRRHGPQALAVLHDLLACAEERDGELVVQASSREVAERLGCLSKDTVHRRLRQLCRAGILEPADPPRGMFTATTYVVHLAGCGIRLTRARQAI